MERLKQFRDSNWAGLALVLLYAIIGLFIFADYGISTDEMPQLRRSHAAYHYVFRGILERSESEGVQAFVERTPLLTSNPDSPYHGVALQMPLVAIEHLRDFQMSDDQVFRMRHAFNFLNYAMAGFFFFLILKRRFPKSPIPLLGLLMYMVYPRLFGGAFYNIKDLMFFSWYIIAGFFALLYLEKPKIWKLFPFALAAALATNTRIAGVSLVLLTMAYVVVDGVAGRKALRALGRVGALGAVFFGMYVLVTPIMWEAPVRTFVSMLSHFADYSPWTGTHFYMGQMIGSDVPWHYIPLWIAATVPILYILLFFLGTGMAVLTVIKNRGIHRGEALYDSYFLALFFLALFGFIGLGIGVYNSWRHAYFLFFSLLYLAVLGLNAVYQRCRGLKLWRRGRFHGALALFFAVIFCYLGSLGLWMVRNHPYQYVYFNTFGRRIAVENFELDYWHVSHMDLLRGAMERTEGFYVYIEPQYFTRFILRPEELARLVSMSRNFAPIYIVRSNVGPSGTQEVIPGYVEMEGIVVDGITISHVLRYQIERGHFDPQAREGIVAISASYMGQVDHLIDGDRDTRWQTDGPRVAGDYIQIEFAEAVSYNLIRLEGVRLSPNERLNSAEAVRFYLSMDGETWVSPEMVFFNRVDHVFAPVEFRFLRIENAQGHDYRVWWVTEIEFGNIDTQILLEPGA